MSHDLEEVRKQTLKSSDGRVVGAAVPTGKVAWGPHHMGSTMLQPSKTAVEEEESERLCGATVLGI